MEQKYDRKVLFSILLQEMLNAVTKLSLHTSYFNLAVNLVGIKK